MFEQSQLVPATLTFEAEVGQRAGNAASNTLTVGEVHLCDQQAFATIPRGLRLIAPDLGPLVLGPLSSLAAVEEQVPNMR